MDQVAVVGIGTTGFGRFADRSGAGMANEALVAALDDADLERGAGEGPSLTAEQRERLVNIWRSSCGALQTVVTDLRITQDELKLAGQFFNRLGQSGMFPSLLAVGLAMTSMRVTEGFEGTPPNLEGPYYMPDAPIRENGVLWEKPLGPHARHLELSGVVRDSTSGKPLPGVELDFWQADDDGIYDNAGYHLRGRVLTDGDGRYAVRSIVPRDYSEHDHDPIGELFHAMERHNRRAAHIHLKVQREGYLPLTTQLYMPDGAYLHDDYVEGAVVPELVVTFESDAADRRKISARFDLAITPARANAA